MTTLNCIATNVPTTNQAPLPTIGIGPDNVNILYRPTMLRVVYTACAKTGNRNARVALAMNDGTRLLDLAWVPVTAAGQTRTYQAVQSGALSAAFASNSALCALPKILMPYGTVLIPYDDSAIAAEGEQSVATSSTATTLTNSAASWTVNAWTGYTVLVGQDVTMVITSNTSTALTGTGGWSDLVAGTAEDSDATSLTDSDASWTTNTWVGYTVEMDSSTATVVSNTDTVLTLDAWSPASPTTGAYKIYGLYTIYGDTAVVTLTHDTFEAS